MNLLINEVFKLQGQQLKNNNIEIIKETSSDMPCIVKGNPIRLEQMIINLVINARDAVNASGKKEKKIEIKTRKIENLHTILIEISDNGTGIDEDIRDKIFKSFFTTKEPGKGTGLGLSMVNKIVKEHGGSIDFDSRKEEGTVFRITLPSESEDRSEDEFHPVEP